MRPLARWRQKRSHSKWVPTSKLSRLLADPNPAVRYQAVWFGGDRTSNGGWRLLIRAALHDPEHKDREKAVYSLSFEMTRKSLVRPLLALYAQPSEHFVVRAQAAEGLANHLCYVCPQVQPIYRKAERALIRGLRDISPEVRFWSAFALGSMRSQKAMPELTRLVETDQTLCPGWWTVGEEASDAIAAIERREVPQRELQRTTLTEDSVPPFLRTELQGV